LIGFLVNCSGSKQPYETQISKFENKAIEKYQLGKFEEALFLCDKAIIEDSMNINLLTIEALCLEELYCEKMALEVWNRILDIDSTNVFSLYSLAFYYINITDFKRAEIFINKAIMYYNDTYQYSISINNMDKFGFHNLFFNNITNAELVFLRGIVNYEFEKFREAFVDFKYCIENNYNVGASHHWLAYIYYCFNDIDKACLELEYAMKNGFSEAKELKDSICK